MNIEVEYIDNNGNKSNKNYYISKLGLVKHMAVSGQRYAPAPHKISRIMGMFFRFSYFLQSSFLKDNKFSQPPDILYDLTEKSHFSNIAGKAIADFLAKKIDNAIYSVNYEAAMKMKNMPIIGGRPDLLVFTNNSKFAIEAKGYCRKYVTDMHKHKHQSQSGRIPVNFTVACVSYNLYDQVRCNYHDPFNDDVEFDDELFVILTKKYYAGLLKFLSYGEYTEVEFNREKFYEIDLFSRYFKEYGNIFGSSFVDLHHKKRLKLILPKDIENYALNGLNKDTEPFLFEGDEYTYIDNDRVGLLLR